MKIIHLRLYQGDARDTLAPVMIMGSRCPLRYDLEWEVGKKFRDLDLGKYQVKINGIMHSWPKIRCEILEWKDSKNRERYAIATKIRFDKDINETAINKIYTLVTFSYHVLKAAAITILPLSWRAPQWAAGSILYSFWFLAYASESAIQWPNRNPINLDEELKVKCYYGENPYDSFVYYDKNIIKNESRILPIKFNIATFDSLEPFSFFLEKNGQKLWEKIMLTHKSISFFGGPSPFTEGVSFFLSS